MNVRCSLFLVGCLLLSPCIASRAEAKNTTTIREYTKYKAILKFMKRNFLYKELVENVLDPLSKNFMANVRSWVLNGIYIKSIPLLCPIGSFIFEKVKMNPFSYRAMAPSHQVLVAT